MLWRPPIDSSTERLIVVGRLVLGVLAAAIVTLEPVGILRHHQTIEALCAAHVGFGVAAAAFWLLPFRVPAYRTITHLLDTAFAVTLIWISGTVGTPFRVFGLFAVMAAGVRFGRAAILGTVIVVAADLGVLAVWTGFVLEDPEYEAIHAGLGLAFLLLLGLVLAELKRREGAVRAELDRLASWTRTGLADPRELIRETLEHAAGIVRARAVFLVWEEREEPWLHVAWWKGGEFGWDREAPHRYEPLVAAELDRRSFFTRNPGAARPLVHFRAPAGLMTIRVAPLHADLARRIGGESVLSVAVEGESVTGRLLLVDTPAPSEDALLTAEIVADLVATRLDQWHALQQTQETAVQEERLRLARDLHDGLLQSLTGVALHVKTAQKVLRSDPDAAVRSLEQLEGAIEADQRSLRELIRHLRPYPSPASATLRLTGRLDDLGSRFQTQFGLDVRMHTDSLSPLVSDEMRHEIFSIVNEALANVAKHSGASRVDVELTNEGDQVRIVVSDDGCGFPFRGTYDLAQLTEMRRGPLTLKERVASLGGSLVIDSTEAGARLLIRVPRAMPGV